MRTFKIMMTAMILAILLAMPSQVLAGGPLFSLETIDDWSTALDNGTITPVSTYYDALEAHYGVLGEDFIQVTPELMALTAAQSGEPDDGLLMYWGDSGSDLPQVATWEYTYPQDPDLTGTKLKLTVMPPPGIWSVSLTINDQWGGWISWDWNVIGAPPPFLPGVLNSGAPNTITIDPNIFAAQAGATSFAIGALGFDPKTAISIQADELAAGAGGWATFPAVPVVGGQQPWNYWSQVTVLPEPISSILFVTGGATLGFRRFRKKRKRT